MQRTTFVYKSPNSTRSLNDHIARLLAWGPYHGLNVLPSSPPSMHLNLEEGYGLTDEGVKIEETLELDNFLETPASDPNFPRIDLVILRHRYNPEEGPNPGTYHIIQGVPTPPPAIPIPRDRPQDIIDDPLHPNYNISMHTGDIILAEIHVHEGVSTITEDMIFNRWRVLTTPEIRAELAEALFMAVGNFVYEGWDLTDDVLNVNVSPGRGLLCGYPEKTLYEFVITTLRAREMLYGPNDQLGNPYQAFENCTLDKQPDYPSKLRIKITSPDIETTGNIYITGENEYGNLVENHAVFVDCPAGGSVWVETAVRFREVYHEGIDAQELERTGNPSTPQWLVDLGHPGAYQINIEITDKPVANIYAVGTQSGRAMFKAIYDRPYTPPCNELLLGWAETDETHVIELVRWATDALAPVTEILNPQCDGVTRQFSLLGIPRENTEYLVFDGDLLLKDSPTEKGYTIVDNVITLQAGVPTPDSAALPHGERGADLWIKYIRQQ